MSYKRQYEMILQYQIKKSRTSYIDYCELVNADWIRMRYLEFLLPKIQDFVEDKGEFEGIQVLLLSVPPQSGKSLSITETLPAWYTGAYPGKRVILVSYGDTLARRFGRRNKEKIREWNSYIFGSLIDQSKRSDIDFEVINQDGRKSFVSARSISGGVTGNPAELIVVDDPIKNREEADSTTSRDTVWAEWQNSITTRLQANGKVIVIATRWHEDDLTGRIIKSGAYDYVYYNIPCEAEENDILGREIGEPLAPEIGKDKKWLKKIKRSYMEGKNEDIDEFGSGPRAWHALFQGNPVIEAGNMIDDKWWKFYDVLPPYFDQALISIDASFKDTDKSDFVVLQVWGKYGMNIYLLDNKRARLGFVETLEAIREMRRKYPFARTTLIEDKANGPAIISVLRKEFMGIIPVEPKGSKAARLSAVTHAIETGYVHIPKNAPWLYEFLQEMKAFPRGANDDQVDALSQALNRLIHSRATFHEETERHNGYHSPGEEEDRQKMRDDGFATIRRAGADRKFLQKERNRVPSASARTRRRNM